jgi:hypothetical protein
MQKMEERLVKLEELESQRATGQPSQRHEDPSFDTAHESTPPSRRKSSVASTELVQPDITAPRYPVDAIMEREHCELMMKCHNLILKVAVGYVLHPRPDATFHFAPIPDGFAVVGVDEVMNGFEGLELDYPTGEGEIYLENALRTTCLWRKENIVLPNWTAPEQTQPEEAPQQTPHSPVVSPLPQSSLVRQLSPPPQLSPSHQRTPAEEAPQQNPPPPPPSC